MLQDETSQKEPLRRSPVTLMFIVLLLAYLAMAVCSFKLASYNISENSLLLVTWVGIGFFFFFMPLPALFNKQGGALTLSLYVTLHDKIRRYSLLPWLLIILMFFPSTVYSFNIWFDHSEPTEYACTLRHANKQDNKSVSYHFYFDCSDIQQAPVRLMLSGANQQAEQFLQQTQVKDPVVLSVKPGFFGIRYIDNYRAL